jgi:hypothetical protein
MILLYYKRKHYAQRRGGPGSIHARLDGADGSPSAAKPAHAARAGSADIRLQPKILLEDAGTDGFEARRYRPFRYDFMPRTTQGSLWEIRCIDEVFFASPRSPRTVA